MVSNIDPTFPISSIDQPSQGFRDNFLSAKIEIEELQAIKVAVDGSTPMTGLLTLSGDPTMAAHASTKQYVDDEIISLGNDISTQLSGKLSLSGGTMAGGLLLAGAPTIALQAATKDYVDTEIAANPGGLQNVSDDTTPSLGGNLNVQSFTIFTDVADTDIVLIPDGTGSLDVSNAKIINVGTATIGTDAVNKDYVDTEISNAPTGIANIIEDLTPQLGGDLDAQAFSIVSSTVDADITLVPNGTGTVDVSSSKITNVDTPTANGDAANKLYVDDEISNAPTGILSVSEDSTPTLGGNLNVGGFNITTGNIDSNITLLPTGTGSVDVSSKKIINLVNPSLPQDAATKFYVDDEISSNLGSGLQDVVDDTSPQLGGNLDTQTQNITTSTVNGDILFSPNGTGGVAFGGAVLKGLGAPVAITDAATKNYVDNLAGIQDVVDDLTPQLGGPLDVLGQGITSSTGNVAIYSLGGYEVDVTNMKIINLDTPTADADATTKLYVDTEIANNVSSGISDVIEDLTPQLGGDLDVLSRNIFTSITNQNIVLTPNGLGGVNVSSKKIISLADPTDDQDAATKKYVDDEISTSGALGNVVDDLTPQLGGNLDVQVRTITTSASNQDIVLTPTGTGTVNVSSSRITLVSEPTVSTDAATKNYVDTAPPSVIGFVEEINFHELNPAATTYPLISSARYTRSTGNFYYYFVSGSLTLTILKNGASVGSSIINGSGNFTTVNTISINTTFAIGDRIQVQISAITSPYNFGFTWVTTRT